MFLLFLVILRCFSLCSVVAVVVLPEIDQRNSFRAVGRTLGLGLGLELGFTVRVRV